MQNSHYLPSLDGIRAICIFLVVGAHASSSIDFPVSWQYASIFMFNGPLGVRVFFVLSGFLITYLLAKEELKIGKISLSNFYLRRILRTVPVYLAFLLVFFLIDRLTPVEVSSCQYLSILTYTKNYFCGSWLDGHLWSLSVEEQFYFLWPACLAFVKKRYRMPVAISLIVTAPFFRIWFYTQKQTGLYLFSFFTNMDSLMIGCVAGITSQYNPGIIKRIISFHPALIRLGSIVIIYLIWIIVANLKLGFLTVPLGATIQSFAASYLILSYALLDGDNSMVYKFLNYKIIRYIGTLSYSWYIWQQLFLGGSGTYGGNEFYFLHFPYNIITSFCIAVVSYHLLEKPLLSLRSRFRVKEEQSVNV